MTENESTTTISPAKKIMIDEIKEAFVLGEASWNSGQVHGSSGGVIYYLSALKIVADGGMFEDDPEVLDEVVVFLQEKTDLASERLTAGAFERIDAIVKKYQPQS